MCNLSNGVYGWTRINSFRGFAVKKTFWDLQGGVPKAFGIELR